MTISKDAKTIISGSKDYTVRRWDTGTELCKGDPLEGHTNEVNSVTINNDGSTVISGSTDRTVHRWEADSVSENFKLVGRDKSELIENMALRLYLPKESEVYTENIEKRIACAGLRNGFVAVCKIIFR